MGRNSSLEEITGQIMAARRIAVVSHYNPDADAYGSSLGLALSLREAGKTVLCLNESPNVSRYDFIPGFETVRNSIEETWDLLVVCDCGSFSRVGETLKGPLAAIKPGINIDHHISNDFFGTLNLVRPEASSTSEVIFDILKAASLPISKGAATCLFAGMVGDTGSFRYSSTTPRTFEVAHELCSLGASPADVGRALFGQNTLASIRLQSDALLNMTLLFDNRVAEVVIPQEKTALYGAEPEDLEGLVEKLRDIQGICIAACIRKDGPIWRISLRSSEPRFNVSDVAKQFGGGGHVQAAAFRWSKGIDELLTRLRKKLEEALS